MPFKLKLRKTRQYNVASKNLFVISVELLDGGIADCTLSVDSTGQECLDNVCQRQAIIQPEFFGLRYISRSQQPRWVQLDRPLKSQLDKYSSSHQLYLRVMYYVISGTSLITDEVTRYHYFLQLKNDLIEGRIICDCQQAVVLAAYSRQAEYGNHDQERHTVDYLKNLLTFPKQMIDGGQIIDGSALAETERLEWLTSAVIQHHISLHNMSQAQAEEGFITACQQLRGYGQEMFTAVDQIKQNEVTIAVSLTGIMVLSETSDTPSFYRWTDITNVINHKRTFSVECTSGAVESASFKLPSPEDGKYVWRLCVLQHTFYMRHQRALIDNHHAQPQPKFQEHGLSESREQLEVTPLRTSERQEPLSPSHRAHSTSCLDLDHHQGVARAVVPQYRPAPDYETAIQQKYQQQRAEAQMRFQNHHHTSVVNKPIVYGSHPDIHRIHYPDVTRHTLSLNQGVEDFYGINYVSHNNYTPFAVNPNVQTDLNPQLHYVNVYKPPPPYPSNGLASNSTPDLALASQYHRGYINSHVSGSSPDLVSNRTALNRQYLGLINNVNVVNYGRPNLVPSTHGTFNNLSSVIDNPHIILDPHHTSEKVMYPVPINRTYQRHVMPPTQLKNNEPIYENVPLPWQNENHGVRNRAQSLTTQDELSRLNGRNNIQPINQKGNINYTQIPKITIDSDSHYVNAQIIKGVRDSSVPKDISTSNKSLTKEISISNRSINKEVDNATKSIEKISLSKDDDETPYTSISTTKINKIEPKPEHVTSINVTDFKTSDYNSNISNIDSAFSSSLVNSTYSTSIHLDSSNDKSSVSSKEKKRRRWGMFIGKGKSEVKSATLGRDRGKPSQPTNKHRWSTGLPKSQPLPPSITKENMCQLLERKMSEMELSFAFELIPKCRENADYTTALLPENAHINGYSSDNIVLPYEDNRVRLQPTPNNRHGYINASHITMTVGSSQRFYVVIRGNFSPPPRLVGGGVEGGGAGGEGVWAAVGQLGAGVVAVLHPGGVYFMPKSRTEVFGQWSVTVTSSVETSWGVISRVETRKEPDRRELNRREFSRKDLNRRTGGESRGVWVLHYKAWTDQQLLPDVNKFLEYLRELSTVEGDSGGWGVSPAPLVVVGRGGAGLALAGDLLLHILDNNQELDIPRTIRQLHLQRANLIENVHQYRFLHQILLHYLKQTRLI